jgi:hypothetical protein
MDAKVNTQSSHISFTKLGTVAFIGLDMMFIGNSWQTAALSLYFKARVKGV